MSIGGGAPEAAAPRGWNPSCCGVIAPGVLYACIAFSSSGENGWSQLDGELGPRRGQLQNQNVAFQVQISFRQYSVSQLYAKHVSTMALQDLPECFTGPYLRPAVQLPLAPEQSIECLLLC